MLRMERGRTDWQEECGAGWFGIHGRCLWWNEWCLGVGGDLFFIVIIFAAELGICVFLSVISGGVLTRGSASARALP